MELRKIEIAGSRHRVDAWLGFELGDTFDGVEFEFTAPNGQPGIDAVTFETPNGLVRLNTSRKVPSLPDASVPCSTTSSL